MKYNYKAKRIYLALVAVVMLAATSCKTEKIVPGSEAPKNIAGNWRVIKATRNGTDLTSIIDFSQFRINFTDKGYSLVNKLPFLVSKDGAFTLDDPQYPYKITFTATGDKPVSTPFTYPIVNGKRQLSITFSPGCANNTYVYVLEKAN
ncbi:protein of unknown function [Mucilaginibacter gossypiicola]|uniref:DUF5004 domain-containing protein n=1 Tax=Mucilaginibacter gossypiicola TaxID=551995 RepID=A0A1H8ANK4_9SPHI|nr:DUF5004 domain-containing protein [Mucilaginibacter gossypiicola]SEM72261.1 protein of unknown function [Mucilaginibacter gossypiicola]